MALSAYVVKKPCMGKNEGDVVHLDEQEAETFGEYVRPATKEEVEGGMDEPVESAEDMEDEDYEPENAALAKAEKRIAEQAAAKILSKQKVTKNRPSFGNTVAAEAKQPVFKNLGDLCRGIWRAKVKGDNRAYNMLQAYENEVRQKSPLGQQEGSNSLGGYAVIPEWNDRLWDKVKRYPKLLDMTDKRTIGSDTLNIPALSETSLQDGSRGGGILAYWVSEGSTLTSSTASLTQVQAVLNTQAVLVYETNQLIADQSYDFDKFITEKVAEEYTFQHNNMVLQGSGTGQPLGVLNQNAYITVAKESGQATASVVLPNLAKMWGRLWSPSRGNAVWLINPEVYQQLILMTFPGASGTFPAAGLSYSANDEYPLKIFGRPAIEVLSAPQLGNSGDCVLADLSQLITAEKAGMEVAVSTDLNFATYQTAFRFVRRYDIRSPWISALTPYDGSSNSFSPFIGIQARGT